MKTKIASKVFVKGQHNIGFVSSSFTEHFGEMEVEELGVVLQSQTLPRALNDKEIFKELGATECTLGDIIATLDAATDDMKDGKWNLFYVQGTSRVVGVIWSASVRVWSVSGWGRDGSAWGEGLRVFSPATDARASALSTSSLSLESAIAAVKEAGYKVIKEF